MVLAEDEPQSAEGPYVTWEQCVVDPGPAADVRDDPCQIMVAQIIEHRRRHPRDAPAVPLHPVAHGPRKFRVAVRARHLREVRRHEPSYAWLVEEDCPLKVRPVAAVAPVDRCEPL